MFEQRPVSNVRIPLLWKEMKNEAELETRDNLIPAKDVEIQRKFVSFRESVWRTITSIEFCSMAVLTTHMATHPVLVRLASKDSFLPTTSVLLSEVMKFLLCTVFIAASLDNPCRVFPKIVDSLWKNKKETAKVCVPALIYAIQNNMYYVALANVDATTYSVTSQLRILTTAILSVCILGKVLSNAQWGALVIALAGAIIVQLRQAHGGRNVDGGNPTLGFLVTFGICWTSAFAGVYFEKMLKQSSSDVWMQNIRLALLSIPFSAATMIASDGERILTGGFFQGYTPMVWLVTTVTALGGLLVSIVMKYADNVRKTYCQSVAIAATALLSFLLGDTPVSLLILLGVTLTVLSVIIYMLFPVPPNHGKKVPLESTEQV